MYQKKAKLGKNRGRPASPRPAGLAPPHTMPCLRSRSNVTCPKTSETRIGCRFDRMDRKACTRIRPTTQCKDTSKSAIYSPGRSQASTRNVGATEGRGEPEEGRPASPRPAGLQLPAFRPRNEHRPQEVLMLLRAPIYVSQAHGSCSFSLRVFPQGLSIHRTSVLLCLTKY